MVSPFLHLGRQLRWFSIWSGCNTWRKPVIWPGSTSGSLRCTWKMLQRKKIPERLWISLVPLKKMKHRFILQRFTLNQADQQSKDSIFPSTPFLLFQIQVNTIQLSGSSVSSVESEERLQVQEHACSANGPRVNTKGKGHRCLSAWHQRNHAQEGR